MRTTLKLILTTIFIIALSSQLVFAQTTKELERARAKWVHYVNKGSKRVEKLYVKQSLLYSQEKDVFGKTAIKQHILQQKEFFSHIKSVESYKLFEHSERKVLDIGTIKISGTDTSVVDSLHYVIAWRKVGNDWLREMDVFLPTAKTPADVKTLDSLRAEWIRYANMKISHALASALFTHSGLYLNNSELSKGQAAITKRFEFIKNPGFNINLKAEKILPVDDETVVDIGNWITTAYVGYYLIIWKKETNGDWKISLYFNF